MNCIKCGREIPDGELFCIECSLTPSAGHEPSGHRPVKTVRPAEREAVAASPVRPGGGRFSSEPAPRRRPVGLIVALVVVCLIAASAITFLAVNYGKPQVQRANLRTREADLTLRESEADALAQQLSDVQTELTSAQSELDAMNHTVSELRGELAGSESSVSQAQYDMTSQQRELQKLSGENAELLTMVDNLETQIDTLNGKISSLTASNAAYSEKAGFMDSYVVFVNNDGTKYYHKYDCRDFKKDSFWAYSRKLAESNGFSACPVCGG